ncbi:hypothetical protein ACVIGV_002918 [Rhizobium leguminosarum]
MSVNSRNRKGRQVGLVDPLVQDVDDGARHDQAFTGGDMRHRQRHDVVVDEGQNAVVEHGEQAEPEHRMIGA